ncbi:MAG: 7-cyano-7-deazaguanine synthase QueC [Muribaculaceae bacterium]|nr:7-cyano-7-deazaguanine synthase QueC [Muribaculaceae bacterium]
MTKSLILLSGGLDSLVSLGLKKEELNVELGLTFDYGQKSAMQEIEASRKICDYYGIKHKVITLDWLREITQTSLVSGDDVPTGEELSNPEQSMKSVWVPNRNGLFLNIAGCFADSFGYNYILIGANKEEAQTFSDNRQEFIDAINNEFEYSTQNTLLAGNFAVENDAEIIYPPRVVAPLINNNKNDIVMLALKSHVPLELTRSCYQGGEKHCGICESCTRLKKALEANHGSEYMKVLFE